ncbi:cyclic nucleotide-binding domain-containing protein [Candidatus Parcubacteria bacterium]|jgi:CRP-like cAMP-binding protein|nr:cyclic nucleotide-binding domain-containing protein [Candidatus Parcubacteria bacterium]
MDKFSLAKLPLFYNLDKKELAFVVDFLTEKKYKQGDKIFNKGKVRDKIIIVSEGLVALETDIEDEEIVALFKAGDSLGEMALVRKNENHQYSVEVASPKATTLELSVYNWYTISNKQPLLANKIYQNLIVRLKDRLNHANNKLVTLFATGKVIGTYTDSKQVAEHIIDIILKIIPSQKALFMIYSNDAQRIKVCQNVGYKKINKDYSYDINKDILLRVLINEPSTILLDKNEWPKEYRSLPYASETAIITPIRIQEKVLGFIILADKTNTHNFSINNKILLEAIASQTAPAIEHINSKELISAQAEVKKVYIDPFTKY